MGLNFRKRSGRIGNGSLLIVPGQPYIGQKVFQTTFTQKKSPYQENLGPEIPVENISPTPTPTPTPMISPTSTPIPSLTPTSTPTPTETRK